jgi:uncharacterized protein YhdP
VDAVRPAPARRAPRVPALDIVVDDLERDGHHLGRLEVLAVHRAGAGPDAGPDWQLDRLRLSNPEALLEARGHWRAQPGAPGALRRSVMDFELELRDAGTLLERVGQSGVLSGGRGRLGGQLAWQGSPLSPDIASLQGALSLRIDEGRFLKAQPGAARLLGVLSLQSLPRRLLLDFRDVFGEGFAFDKLEGEVRVDGGVARTRDLHMLGVQAAVMLDGQASLVQETQDLRVVVVPELNAGAASLAYAVVNPVVGLSTFVAQLLMRKPMMAASTREFHVHGSWADPQVDRVERRAPPDAGAGAPGVAAPPAPASAPSGPPGP